jgi:extracellular solute-binding protein
MPPPVRSRIVALVIASALIGVAFFARSRVDTRGGTTVEAPRVGGGRVEVLCAPETQGLCHDAATLFNERRAKVDGRIAEISVSVEDTTQAAAEIGAKTRHPLLWMPSSSAWIDAVNASSRERAGRDLIFRSGRYQAVTIALSPLVVAVWSDRAALLQRLCPSIGVRCLRQVAVTQGGWAALGAPASWGVLKLGVADPFVTDDGLLTLGLAAYVFRSAITGLSVSDVDGERSFLYDLEASRTSIPEQGDLAGPSSFDAELISERTAVAELDSAKNRYPGGLRLFYPEVILEADHPLAILADDSTSAEDKDVAVQFRDYLRSAPGQALVSRAGFRPGNQSSDLTEDSPLRAHVSDGVLFDLPAATADIPAHDVLDRLQTLWTACPSARPPCRIG